MILVAGLSPNCSLRVTCRKGLIDYRMIAQYYTNDSNTHKDQHLYTQVHYIHSHNVDQNCACAELVNPGRQVAK